MLAEIQVTSQTVVWNFRLSKAGRPPRSPNFKRASRLATSPEELSSPKKCLARRWPGEARPSSQGGEKVTRPIQSMGRRHDAFSFSDLLRKPRASPRGPGRQRWRRRPMSGQAALARPLLPSPHGLRSHPSTVATSNHRVRVRDPSVAHGSRPSARA